MSKELNLTLQVWRQDGPDDSGQFEIYKAENISEDMSFLELLDIINEDLVRTDKYQSSSIMTVAKVSAALAV